MKELLTVESLTTEIVAAREHAEQLRNILALANMTASPLTLLVMAIAEFYTTCLENNDLPDTKDMFATQVTMMANTLALIEYAIASSEKNDKFNELPDGAFVVPGPVEPQ